MFLEFISKGTGPGGKDEVIPVSTDNPMPSNAQINGDVTIEGSVPAGFKVEDFVANDDGADYLNGNKIRKVTAFDLDSAGITRASWYNLGDGAPTTAPVVIAEPTVNTLEPISGGGSQQDLINAIYDAAISPIWDWEEKRYTALSDNGTFWDGGDQLLNIKAFDKNVYTAKNPEGFGGGGVQNDWFNLTKQITFSGNSGGGTVGLQEVVTGGSGPGVVQIERQKYIVTQTHSSSDPGTSFQRFELLEYMRFVLPEGTEIIQWARINEFGIIDSNLGDGIVPDFRLIKKLDSTEGVPQKEYVYYRNIASGDSFNISGNEFILGLQIIIPAGTTATMTTKAGGVPLVGPLHLSFKAEKDRTLSHQIITVAGTSPVTLIISSSIEEPEPA